MKWRLLNTGYNDPAFNMALDEAGIILLSQGKISPTIRFYGWKPPGLSIGYLQSVSGINEDACKTFGVEIVRRITGGRAVLHDDELTYSLLVPEAYSQFSQSVLDTYKYISNGILYSLKHLGITACMNDLARTGRNALNPHNSDMCFDTSSRYEVVVNGKKLVGSAQCRKYGVLLQHGSVINSFDTEKFFSLFRFTRLEQRERMKEIFLQKATSIQDILGYRHSFDTLAGAFTKGFQEGLKIDLEPDEPTKEELHMAQMLIEEKYADKAWNFRR
jgi:lipoate-protein ligase A